MTLKCCPAAQERIECLKLAERWWIGVRLNRPVVTGGYKDIEVIKDKAFDDFRYCPYCGTPITFPEDE